MTVQDVLNKARALIDEWTEDGVVISDDDVIDLLKKGIEFVDMGQKDLYQAGRLYKSFTFSHKPIDNKLGSGFDIDEFLGTTLYYPGEEGVQGKSYYIEIDNPCTVEVQENQSGTWTTLATHTTTNSNQYEAFKGNLSLVSDGNVRIKVSGTSYARIRNKAIFDVLFNEVPDYRPWFLVDLPTDFRTFCEVVELFPIQNYSISGNYRLEGRNKLYASWDFCGELRGNYFATATTVTELTDELEIDDHSAINVLPYYVAAMIATSEYPSLVQYYNDLYQEKKFALNDQPGQEVSIVDYYERSW